MKSLGNNDFLRLIMLSFITEVYLHNFHILFFYGKLQKLVNLKENCFYGYAFGSLRKKSAQWFSKHDSHTNRSVTTWEVQK